MSTFFVTRVTIDAAVAAFIAEGGPLSLEAATDLGRALWAMNAEAVRWRYDLDTGTPEEHAEHEANLAAVASYAWTPRDLALAVIVKSLDCLHNQCCEGPVCETALYGRLTALANHHDAGGVRDTAEYEQAHWGLDEVDPPAEAGAPSGVRFRSELTPEGEQLVIPGCERNRSSKLRQLDLFG
ncbi:hypothetical protein [Rubellimicrobium roseum]|uniref:Uncharacterized protein n=1 Tax=Rubellimicrobium roseum TaxID=687525 RepID=A0A5C4N668_9RHOB|nr:hypothetical protein [Rubellimicrobium roseum]TNC65797.1 hypothetical protein FHG71_17265 [Rubellimicrobium roseum]